MRVNQSAANILLPLCTLSCAGAEQKPNMAVVPDMSRLAIPKVPEYPKQ